MSSPADLNARLERIENALMHLEYSVGQIGSALSSQQTRIQVLERGFVLLREHTDAPPEPVRNPAEEKPPHY